MRLEKRRVTDDSEIRAILDECRVARIAMLEGKGRPYIVPMCYGYELGEGRLALYFHCATQGKKIELLRNNPSVCFEMDCGYRLIKGSAACDCTCEYASVIGWGQAELLADPQEKRHGLEMLMRHTAGGSGYDFLDKHISNTCVIRILSTDFICKKNM